jgi:hypothetical protein
MILIFYLSAAAIAAALLFYKACSLADLIKPGNVPVLAQGCPRLGARLSQTIKLLLGASVRLCHTPKGFPALAQGCSNGFCV